jgi:CheY-like chemotaxis protein
MVEFHDGGTAGVIQVQPDQGTRFAMENSEIFNEASTDQEVARFQTLSGYGRLRYECSRFPEPKVQFANSGPVGVLIVDDNRLNGSAIRRSFGALQASIPIFEVRTCGEAWDVLHGAHSRIDALPPSVMLLNLDMPGSFDFLRAVRQEANHATQNAIVFVHSKSNSAAQRNSAYAWNIAGYIHDRPGRKSLLSLARLLREYIVAVELPDHYGALEVHETPQHRTSGDLIEMPALNVASIHSITCRQEMDQISVDCPP